MTGTTKRLFGALAASAVLGLMLAPGAGAATRSRVGACDDYAVIADQAITSSGATAITGSVAIAATQNLAGFPPGTIAGETHLADAAALDAAGAAATVNVDIQSQPCNSDRTGQDQGGLRIGEAVYCYVLPATLDGELRLDALGDPDAIFIFQIAGSYEVTSGSRMILANGAQACNVFWRITGTMTVGTGAELAGTFVSQEQIQLGDGVILNGRLFAPQGSVQLNSNTISQSACSATSGQVTTTTTSPTTTPPTEDPTTTVPVPTTVPTTTPGGGAPSDGSGTGSGNGTGDGPGGLAATGPLSLSLAVLAAAAMGMGHTLIGTERVARWNARRWRPRHAASRLARLRRRDPR